jgi:hypothetical protein
MDLMDGGAGDTDQKPSQADSVPQFYPAITQTTQYLLSAF